MDDKKTHFCDLIFLETKFSKQSNIDKSYYMAITIGRIGQEKEYDGC